MSSITKVLTYARSTLSHSKRRRHTLELLVSALRHPSLYAELFDYVETKLPKGVPPATARHIVEHATRRYVRRFFSAREKINMMRFHYDLFGARIDAASLELMPHYPGLVLAELIGKSGRSYKITLHHSMTKEGEIAIRFMDTEQNMELAWIRGVFGLNAEGHKVFWISVLQGPISPLAREAISTATRDLNVLRPKQAVLYAVCAFCKAMGVDTLYALPHENHVSYNWWRSLFTKHKILSDYDGFWQEFTTQRTPKGDYILSPPFPRRKPEEVQAKRRKDWLQRYARIDGLTESIVAALEAFGKNSGS